MGIHHDDLFIRPRSRSPLTLSAEFVFGMFVYATITIMFIVEGIWFMVVWMLIPPFWILAARLRATN